MTSERLQRRIGRLLDEAEQAMDKRDWARVRDLAGEVLTYDPGNKDALAFIASAERGLTATGAPITPPQPPELPRPVPAGTPAPTHPASFANGRYAVKRFLGEGGKKRVYLAHDTVLDRDVAFALIKTEGLDDVGKARVTREAQVMARLSDHPHVMQVYDLGQEKDSQPFMVLPLMGGGDVEGLIKKAPNHQLPLERAIQIAVATAKGLVFAHGKGVVHRDLKPGNVWMAADGTPKIGDFGLAVAVEATRLTTAGMMVGTVNYMPPEQAMGGEVTAKADLYSLGAMLYEMVTGRPPFVGDDAVAIIGQHLNTPPVAPTWHRPDCPPALEGLILRLLEKDPTKRPPSAGDVLKALEGMGKPTPNPLPEKEGASGSAPSSFPGKGDGGLGSPVYRSVFVGREAELKQLNAAFDHALAGQGGLVMVVGEPGIGKTAVCEQLATYAALRGGKALVGHCYEEGSLSLPYLAFVEAMRSYVLAREPEALKKDLGTGAAEVARVVSEIRDRVNVELRPSGDPEDDRYRLLQAISGFLRNAASVNPLLIVLEDLHWADKGTLDLLLHVARNLDGARLLIVGTYRDVEVDRSHPLSGTLGELRRAKNFARVPLRGLTADEVHRMLTTFRGEEANWAVAEAIHRQTEGNPLFIQEVVRYIVEEGLVKRQDGRWLTPGEALIPQIPEGLRDVIGRRLSRLSAETNRVLANAAVIGRDFRLDTLQAVAALPEEAVITALEEAERVGVVQEQTRPGGIQYRFAHAFFRQTLYEELSGPRRLRLHQQVARAIESQFVSRLDEHAAELAEHFGLSTDPADLAKAIGYAERAAQKAMAVFAYGEAERHLGHALEVQEVLDPSDKAKHCDLLLAFADALALAGEPKRAYEQVAEEAFGLAEALNDVERQLATFRVARLAMFTFTGVDMVQLPEYRRWSDRVDGLAAPGTRDRALADLQRSTILMNEGRWQEAHDLRSKALAEAEAVGDPETLSAVLHVALAGVRVPADIARVEGWAERAFNLQGVRQTVGVLNRQFALWAFLSYGRRNLAEEGMKQQRLVWQRTQNPLAGIYAHFNSSLLATLDGRLDEALGHADECRRLGEQIGSPARGRLNQRTASFGPLLYLGRTAEALAQWETAMRGSPINHALVWAHMGDTTRARQAIANAIASLRISSEDPVTPIPVFHLLAAAVLCQASDHLPLLYAKVRPFSGSCWAFYGGPQQFVPARSLGGAAALLGDYAQARAYYAQALEVAGKIRFRPEIALARLELAELLLDRYPAERAEAIAHLDVAIGEFREMKMQPSLERALKRKEILKA